MTAATGFTSSLRSRCADRCAFYGEPPCWSLPDLTSDCEPITPCDDCLHDKPNVDEASNA